ncbi:SDR family NAD(P)-dependent oxidoreductase [Vibrio mexicanus]|uniref:SDR family NAD(P)-dependent oxidoreductase n=1 Tax=Vibrio mexicanus TaxID=1004326 RepID=UPI00063C0D36|nr:SDR family oxidoreductase [Vibrio mexicanus]
MRKHVLITGASGGIGKEVCDKFIEQDYNITALSNEFGDFVHRNHSRVECIEFDLTKISEIPNVISSLPKIDTLVNNAGVMFSSPYDEYPEKLKALTIKVNLEAPITLVTEVARQMKQQGSGRIVNNTSIAAHIGHPDIWYGVTKSGLLNATKSFAKLLGPHGVMVNAIASGPVMTPMMESIDKDRLDKIKDSSLTGRFAYPEEVADTIVWLGSCSPKYINGSCIDINDGAYFR